MTIHEMKVFVNVYELNSIRRTADMMFLSQPAVSRVILTLEKEYGVQFFERLNRRLFPTDAAKRMYTSLIQVLDEFEKMEKELVADSKVPVRVGATTTIGSVLLPVVITEFHKKNKDIPVITTISNATRLIDKLGKNEIDFAFVETFADKKDMIIEDIYTDRLILVFSPECKLCEYDTISFSDLSEYPLLLRDEESMTQNMLDQILFYRGITISPVLESGSILALISFLHKNLGISFIPDGLAKPFIEHGILNSKPIIDGNLTRKNFLVRHKDKLLSPSCRDFISMCKNYGKSLGSET